MAQYDVHRLKNLPGIIVDCQADLLDHIDSRFVVPLVAPGDLGRPVPRLNPVFLIDGAEYVMLTQAAAAIPIAELGPVIDTLAEHDREIINALDILITGV